MSHFVGEGSRRFLIVVADKDLREGLGNFFRTKGFDVSDVTTAVEAITLLQSGSVTWDYLITDYSMPGMNGSDLIIWCSIWKVRFKKTIILSDSDITRSGKLLLDIGVTIKVKPVSPDELLQDLMVPVSETNLPWFYRESGDSKHE